jgi:pyruvate,water dikinase
MRELMGARESPKFFAVRLFGEVRQNLLSAGAELVKEGLLDRADDLMFLTYSELRAFSRADSQDWKQMIAGRRAAYDREKMRRQIPRLLLSDGRAFYEGITAPETIGSNLLGSPVSPGVAQGQVRVVIDPRQANLRPGEIMVCPGTDPSWTPLFLSAAGLVMETGGMMTHGAVVAREYGIPAIVGVDQATHRLKTGQRIRIDGSSGLIALLDGEQE